MSRSYKRPIIKDAGGYGTYYRTIKRRVRQYLRESLKRLDDPTFNFVIPQEKEIVNDYDVCDWVFDYEHRPLRYPRYHNRYSYSVEDAKRDREENIKKYSRK